MLFGGKRFGLYRSRLAPVFRMKMFCGPAWAFSPVRVVEHGEDLGRVVPGGITSGSRHPVQLPKRIRPWIADADFTGQFVD